MTLSLPERARILTIVPFLLGLAIRSIPEILGYPHPLGFDTIYYAAVLGKSSNCLMLSDFATSPLMPILLCPFAKLFEPVIVLKVYPVITYGLLGAASYRYASSALAWNSRKSLIASSLLLVQFVSLRMSWDLHRNMISLVMLLWALPLLDNPSRRQARTVFLTFAALAIAMTHELVGVLLVVLAIGQVLKPSPCGFVRQKRILPPAVMLLSGIGLLTILPSIPAHSVLTDYTPYYGPLSAKLPEIFVGSYITILPLAVFGLSRYRTLGLWTLACLIGTFSWLFQPGFGLAYWDRWMFMLVIPFSFYAVNGMTRLATVLARIAPRRLSGTMMCVKLFILLLVFLPSVFLAGGFMTYPVEKPYWYFDNPTLWHLPGPNASGIPASMLSNTTPLGDNEGICKALLELDRTMGEASVLLTDTAFRSWALLCLGHNRSIIEYAGGALSEALILAQRMGFKDIYVIWWTHGRAWYGGDLDSVSFQVRIQSGRIAIYEYHAHVPLTAGV